jgi:hypothetical protein
MAKPCSAWTPRLPGMTVAHGCAASRAGPEGAKIEGARAPKGRLPIANAGSLVMAEPCFAWAPAAVFSAGRGCGHDASEPLVPPGRYRRRAPHRSGTASCCGNSESAEHRRLRRASVRSVMAEPCFAWTAHSLASPAPASEGATSRRGCERSSTASTGHRPRPATDAQAWRVPRGQGCGGSMGERGGAGISFVQSERRYPLSSRTPRTK